MKKCSDALYRGLPRHVQKLRASARSKQRDQSRKEFKDALMKRNH
jgi:hypothetical protein